MTDLIPRCTYRIQFHKGFTFRDAVAVVPYLGRLGVSHVYASPFLKARPGSTHGYDIVDHHMLNPELGGEEALGALAEALRAAGMGLIADVVPNHMGVGGSDNVWWLDVLENGQASAYAGYFDIDWKPVNPYLRGKVLIPVLGDHYGDILERGELSLVFEGETGEFSIWYFQHRFPLDPRTYPEVLGHGMGDLEREMGAEAPMFLELQHCLDALGKLPPPAAMAASSREERIREQDLGKGRLKSLWERSSSVRDHVSRCVARFAGGAGGDPSGRILHELLELQPYRLAHWKVAADEVNYRRFFDINDLAALRVEDEDVFRQTHELVLRLIREDRVQGLRVDHPDGLNDPARYLERLARSVGSSGAEEAREGTAQRGGSTYLVVEKILAPYEDLPRNWPVHGTTGYDFLNLVNGLFVDPEAERRLTGIYRRWTRERLPFDELLYECKKRVMEEQLSSELTVLSNLAFTIAQADHRTRDFTVNGLRSAIEEILAFFPVYRTYIDRDAGAEEDDRRYIEWALAKAGKVRRGGDASALDFLGRLLLLKSLYREDTEYRSLVLDFVMKFQQVSAPVMAKGFEDTACYRFNRLVSLNEVGGEPDRFGVSPGAFHRGITKRSALFPHSMLASSTHDTKRSEDVRARINVLSECPELWNLHLGRWSRVNRRKRSLVDDVPAPSRNDEYLIYQTLLGAWPREDPSGEDRDRFLDRMIAYAVKAVREGKQHSSWNSPNEEYERCVAVFVRRVLQGEASASPFLKDFLPFQKKVSFWGLLNSLSQSTLKLTVPGVPDIYQGTESWDFSLVDPDNRRPVDFGALGAALEGIMRDYREPEPAAALRLSEGLMSGEAKLFLVWKLLELRGEHPELFTSGAYVPLVPRGDRKTHLCTFARRLDERAAVVVVPRLLARLGESEPRIPLGAAVWGDTRVEVPGDMARCKWKDVFTGRDVSPRARKDRFFFPVAEVLTHFPVSVLVPREPFRFGPAGTAAKQ